MNGLLGAAEIREIAERIGVRPTKKLGQNFVVDANTCRKIVKSADVGPDDVALEIGPGLGSLTLAMLESAKSVIAIEIDDRLALELPPALQQRRRRARAAKRTAAHPNAKDRHAGPHGSRSPRQGHPGAVL